MMTKTKPNAFTTIALICLALITCVSLSACISLRGSGGSGGSATITSDANQRSLKAKFPLKAYTFSDNNTANIYLTDLTDEELTAFFAPKADWSKISGTLVQIHLFLDPEPGKTPIEHTAATASIRYAIITNGHIGIYDGAGFMLPGSKPGKDSISGHIRSAPLRITRATPNFQDILNASKISIEFDAKLEDAQAAELRARLDAMAAKTMPVHD